MCLLQPERELMGKIPDGMDYQGLLNFIKHICGDRELKRYTPKVFYEVVDVSGMSNDAIFNCYESFIATVGKLRWNSSWYALASMLHQYGIGTRHLTTWRLRCTAFLEAFVEKNKLLNTEERWSELNEADRAARTMFKDVTMLIDAFPCVIQGCNTDWWDCRKRCACISTSVLTDTQGHTLAFCTGQKNTGDGKKLHELGCCCTIRHFKSELILADGAYTACGHTLCPWKAKEEADAPQQLKDLEKLLSKQAYKKLLRVNGLSDAQYKLVLWIKKVRGRVEQTFGRITNNWPFFHGTKTRPHFTKLAIAFAITLEKYYTVGMREVPEKMKGAAPYVGSFDECECQFENVNETENALYRKNMIEILVDKGLVDPEYKKLEEFRAEAEAEKMKK